MRRLGVIWTLLAVAIASGCYAQMEPGGGGGGDPSPSPSPSPYFGPSPDRTFPYDQ